MTAIRWQPGDRVVVSGLNCKYAGPSGTVLRHHEDVGDGLTVDVALDGLEPNDYAGFESGELTRLSRQWDAGPTPSWSVRFEDRGRKAALVTDLSPRQARALKQDLEALLDRYGRDGGFFVAPARRGLQQLERRET